MPHSVSPEEPATPNEDAIVEEPKPDNVETQESEGTAIADSVGPIGESQASEGVDEDMAMEDAGGEEEEISEPPVKTEIKSEVKLEDLFADIDSDEEFPSSAGQDEKLSSSPEAPEPPM